MTVTAASTDRVQITNCCCATAELEALTIDREQNLQKKNKDREQNLQKKKDREQNHFYELCRLLNYHY